MKRYFIFPLLVLMAVASAAQEPASQSQASVCFFRLPNYMGAAIGMTIRVDDTPVIKMKNNSMFVVNVEPGERVISCQMGELARLVINTEPGKKYYVECLLNPGAWSAIPVLRLVDEKSGESVVRGGTLNQLTWQPLSSAKPKSRIGVLFSGGIGFENILMGYTTENDELKLSTGGGFSIGAEYGFEATRNFDISATLLFHSSALTPPVKNADASFTRLSLAITPAAVIPIKGGDYMRLRIGAGAALYFNERMEVEGAIAGGNTYLIRYNPTIGLQGSLVFESNISDKSSFIFGVKPYIINYILNEEGSTGTSTDPLVLNPKGSGIDFQLGYHFRF